MLSSSNRLGIHLTSDDAFPQRGALGILANRAVLPPHERTFAVIDGSLAWSGTHVDPDLYMKLMEQVFAALLPDGASIQIAGHPNGNRLAGAFLGLNLEQAVVRPIQR